MTTRDLEGWTIAFDLDGTLVETAPDIVGTLNRLLVQHELPVLPLEQARNLIGHGAVALLKRGFEAAGAVWDETASPALLKAFLADYMEHIAEHSTAYPGAIEALDELAAQGAILCVATNKPTDLSVALFRAIGLESRFKVICGPQSVSAKKPDAAHIRETVLQAGGDPARAIMVGDSITDLNAARATGVPCILTSFGYTDIPAAELGADAVIDHFSALPAVIGRLIT
ncbi:HAD-IA family hydrolase [Brevundimonas sp. Root1279]|uniref:HAD-IA family hydrolase n=1 Tax=Brevundimonas sp. Root1279 TaxID=1736443 RepID=UPI0006FBBDBF|nr:HAD-IA family hydrolase [Brevundimonas sp. Root1279]KQW79867.1 phosphoglycolate phosphatase [Brevundimonas sp. Root1279]